MLRDEQQGSVRSADGTQIGWFETGDGPPLVLVHGTTADHSRWATVIDQLGEHFRCYAVDRRGRGTSGDTDPYELEREFEDITAVIDAIDGPVNVLGHSYGALCSLEAATRTANIGALILYEPPLPVGAQVVSPDTMDRIDALIAADDREGALEAFMRDIVQVNDEQLAHLRSLPAWKARIAAAHTLGREQRMELTYVFEPDRFRDLQVRTLLLSGEESPAFLTEAIRSLEKILPNARVAVMPGQQHAAMDTGTDLFLQEVLGFLRER